MVWKKGFKRKIDLLIPGFKKLRFKMSAAARQRRKRGWGMQQYEEEEMGGERESGELVLNFKVTCDIALYFSVTSRVSHDVTARFFYILQHQAKHSFI